MTYVNNNYNILSGVKYTPQVHFRGIVSPFGTNPYHQSEDSYNSANNIEFSNKLKIEALARSNPTLMSELKSNKIPLNVNIDELQKLKKGHMTDTYVIASKIYSSMPLEYKNKINKIDLMNAARYHDYGKALIPKHILNKQGSLTDKEKAIMDLHSSLGAELLKMQGLSDNTTALIKYHHQTPDASGYPAIQGDFRFGPESQILAAADKYSALTEKRSYKDALSKQEALEIISQDVKNGIISEDVYNALEKAVA